MILSQVLGNLPFFAILLVAAVLVLTPSIDLVRKLVSST